MFQTMVANVIKKTHSIIRKDFIRLFVTGVPHLFVAMLFTQGMSLIRRICLARFLSVPEMGQLAYVMQIADLVAMVADIGLCTAVLKYAAEPVDQKEKSRLYSTGMFWGLIISSFIAVFYMVIALAVTANDEELIRTFMLLVVPYVPLSALAKIPLTYMQACKQIKRASVYTIFTRLISFSAIVVATYYFKLFGFFITVTAIPLSNLIILLFATRKHIVKPDLSKALFKKLIKFGFVSMSANVVGFMNSAVSIILLRYLTKSNELVGYYSIALVIMNGFRLIPNVLLRVAFPYLSGLLNEPDKLRRRMFELIIKQGTLMLGVLVVWYLLGKPLTIFVFGEEYARSFMISIVLISSLIPFSLTASVAQTLLVLGKVKLNLLISAVQLVVNTLLCLILIPKYDSIGVAVATLVSQSFCSILLVIGILFTLTKFWTNRAPGNNNI